MSVCCVKGVWMTIFVTSEWRVWVAFSVRCVNNNYCLITVEWRVWDAFSVRCLNDNCCLIRVTSVSCVFSKVYEWQLFKNIELFCETYVLELSLWSKMLCDFRMGFSATPLRGHYKIISSLMEIPMSKTSSPKQRKRKHTRKLPRANFETNYEKFTPVYTW